MRPATYNVLLLTGPKTTEVSAERNREMTDIWHHTLQIPFKPPYTHQYYEIYRVLYDTYFVWHPRVSVIRGGYRITDCLVGFEGDKGYPETVLVSNKDV